MEIEVKICGDCPFCLETELPKRIATFCAVDTTDFMDVEANKEPPSNCPLRKEPITIKLKS